MRKILILISLVLFSALSFGQGAMMGSVGASGGGYGSNMITNGTFDDGTDWTEYTAALYISGGVANFDNSIANSRLRQYAADMVSQLESDSHYKLTFWFSGSAEVQFQNGNGSVTYVAQDSYTSGAQVVEFDTGTITNYGFSVYVNTLGGAWTMDTLILQKRE